MGGHQEVSIKIVGGRLLLVVCRTRHGLRRMYNMISCAKCNSEVSPYDCVLASFDLWGGKGRW